MRLSSSFESLVCAVFVLSALIMKFEPAWADRGLFMAYGYVAGFLGDNKTFSSRALAR